MSDYFARQLTLLLIPARLPLKPPAGDSGEARAAPQHRRGRRGPCDFDLASTRTILLFFDCCLVLLFLRDSRTRISLGVHASLHTGND